MRKIFVATLLFVLTFSAMAADGERYHAEWKFAKPGKSKLGTAFLATGRYGASGSDADLTFYRKGKKAANGERDGVMLSEKGYPTAEFTNAKDCWMFEMDVEKLASNTAVSFWLNVVTDPVKPSYGFVVEYLDGKKWLPVAPLDVNGVNYTTTTSAKHPRNLWSTIRVENIATMNRVLFRLRCVQGKLPVKVSVMSPSGSGRLTHITCYDERIPQDTLRMLFLGNSYTYYHTYPAIFKEIAWREGHYADCRAWVSGGYTMKAHLANVYSREAVDAGGYDYVFLQDQSILPTLTGTEDDAGTVEQMAKMVERVKAASPKAQPVIEITWGRKFGNNNFGKKYEMYIEKYPHFYADDEAMQARLIEVTTAEAEQLGTALSPVGIAWRIVRRERPDIELYAKDAHHQSYAGSYLAAAVAYLTVYKVPFGANPANADLKAETAAYLRSVAERVVLGGEK